MGITRRSFLTGLSAAFGGAVISSSGLGCISMESRDVAPVHEEFERQVEAHYRAIKNRVESIPPSTTIGRVALIIQDGTHEDERSLDFLMRSAIDAAYPLGTDEEKVAAMQKVFQGLKPYKETLLFRDTVRGAYSDCDTRSILFLEAAERMGVALPLSLILVQGHAYLRLNHNPEKNWETTVHDGELFTIQDHLHPSELTRDEVINAQLIDYARHVRQEGYNRDDSPKTPEESFDHFARSAALARFAAQRTSERYNTYAAQMQLGALYVELARWKKIPVFTEKARLHYERAYEAEGSPHALIALERTYQGKDGSPPDEQKSDEILRKALDIVHTQEKELEPISGQNAVLYFKTSRDYTGLQIEIIKRRAELPQRSELIKMFPELAKGETMLLGMLEEKYQLDDQMYQHSLKTRSLIDSVRQIDTMMNSIRDALNPDSRK